MKRSHIDWALVVLVAAHWWKAGADRRAGDLRAAWVELSFAAAWAFVLGLRMIVRARRARDAGPC
jgi:hypothetical protein